MLRQIYALCVKELKWLCTDPAVLVVLFVLPLVFVVVMTYAGVGNQTQRDARILAVNEDRGDIAQQVIERLRIEKGLQVFDEVDGKRVTDAHARQLLSHAGAEYVTAIVFPADFTQHLRAAGNAAPPQLTFLADAANGGQNLNPVERLIKIQIMAVASAVATESEAQRRVHAALGQQRNDTADATITQQLRDIHRSAIPEIVFERTTANGTPLARPLTAEEQNVPGYTIFGIFFIVQIIGGTLLREREFGTFARLRAAPLARPVILIGKLIPFYLINLVQLFFMFGVGWIVFHLSFGNSFGALLLIALCTAAVANALGMFVAAVSKTNEQMGPLSGILLVSLSALGGIFIPYYEMPRLMQKLCFFTPHAWALKGLQDVLVRGYGFASALPTAGVLVLFAAAFYILAVFRFRFE